MGFFDLNIPYPEPSSQNNKSTVESNRTRLAVKAMELGYTGIAYNRTMKGVMSDHHRCSISLLSLSSLLNIVPFLSSSAKLHRDLLGIPSSTPFRQYTRLTVCVDNPAQAQALNSGNPILKTYDLVAVKPLNQTAFDLACERMEVDIISIDFSNKLPFRLKQPMVKAATQRGVCFEVSYCGLLADVQMRRQLISSAKLLIDWTRGRNIVFSSAASSVNELRGPCDVANLLSLFGLSKEQAKAAISKNCRTLLANSLRKKQFYKEAIKVEVLSSDVSSHSSNEAWHQELLKWDPISSGEGDILLDDMGSSCSASSKASKASKTAKAINFLSVVNSLPSHGFQVQDFLPNNGAFTASPKNKVNFTPVTQKANQSTPVLNNLTEQPNILDICPTQDENLPLDGIEKHQTVSRDNFFEENIQSGTAEASMEDIYTQTNATKLELKNTIDPSLEVKAVELQSNLCILSNALDTVKPHENEKLVRSSNDQQNIDDKVEILTLFVDIIFRRRWCILKHNGKNTDVNLNAQIFKMQEDFESAGHTMLEINASAIETSVEDGLFDKREPDAQIFKMQEDLPNEDFEIAGHTMLEINASAIETSVKDGLFDKREPDAVELEPDAQVFKMQKDLPKEDFESAGHTMLEINASAIETSVENGLFAKREPDSVELEPDEMPQQMPFDEMKTQADSTVAMHLLPDLIMEDKQLGEVRTGFDQLASVQSASGRLRVKRRTSRAPLLFRQKTLLNQMTFKKKGKKDKRINLK